MKICTIHNGQKMLRECFQQRPLNGHELALLEDKEYIRFRTELLTGYKLSDNELDIMIHKIKSQA